MDGFRKLVQHSLPTHTHTHTRPSLPLPRALSQHAPPFCSDGSVASSTGTSFMYTAVRSANCTCRSPPRVEFAYRLPLILWTTRSIFHDATCTPNYGAQHHTVDRVLLRIPLLVPNRNPMIPLTKLRVTNKRDCLPEVLTQLGQVLS